MLLLTVAGGRQCLLPPGLLSAEAAGGANWKGLVPLVQMQGSRQPAADCTQPLKVTPQAGCCWETRWRVPLMTLPCSSHHGVAQPGLIPASPVAGHGCRLLVSARRPGRLKQD